MRIFVLRRIIPDLLTTELADEFIEHLGIRHPEHYKFPITVSVKLAKPHS
jgi:hypothetical protein